MTGWPPVQDATADMVSGSGFAVRGYPGAVANTTAKAPESEEIADRSVSSNGFRALDQ